jgi:7,8-dihydroneopterin aldolase/epimerase/oxygenase
MVKSEQQRLHIVDLKFEAVVGILKFERESPQNLIVNATMDVDFDKARHIDSDMNRGVDYARMVEFLTTQIQTGGYGLLEELLDTVGRDAFVTFPDLNALELKVEKPDILDSCKAVGASIFLRRER